MGLDPDIPSPPVPCVPAAPFRSSLWVVVVKSGPGSCCHDLKVDLLCVADALELRPSLTRFDPGLFALSAQTTKNNKRKSDVFFLGKNKQSLPVCESSDLAGGDINLQPTGTLFLPTEGQFSSLVSGFLKRVRHPPPTEHLCMSDLSGPKRGDGAFKLQQTTAHLRTGAEFLVLQLCFRLHMSVQPSFRHGPLPPNCFFLKQITDQIEFMSDSLQTVDATKSDNRPAEDVIKTTVYQKPDVGMRFWTDPRRGKGTQSTESSERGRKI